MKIVRVLSWFAHKVTYQWKIIMKVWYTQAKLTAIMVLNTVLVYIWNSVIQVFNMVSWLSSDEGTVALSLYCFYFFQ